MAAIIFLFLAMAGSFYPCCLNDDCAAETTQSGSHSPHKEDCKGFCSPFSVCASCASSVEIPTGNFHFQQLKPAPVRYNAYIVANGEEVYSSLFQPPRHC